jgi:glycosyltransferase involved in cell wall biosynthesis
MKILLIHNFAQSSAPSGETVAFENDRRLLEQGGHEVLTYTRHSDSITSSVISRANAAFSLFWSQSAFRDIAALIHQHRPDIAHFHNTFPLLSVSGYRACRAARVPVIQTLHNYRLICPTGLLLRGGKPCSECVDRSLLSAVRHACYRQSRVASGLVAAMLATNRRRSVYHHDVDRYICLTESARQRFVLGGLPESKLTVRPNGLANPPAVGHGNGGYALFVGRLTPEKGAETLLTAWHGIDFPLRVVGDGHLRAKLEQESLRLKTNVTFEGMRSHDEVAALMQGATFLVIPSEWYEGFPFTLLEALACGTPLIVSAIGALDELLDAPANGLKFSAGDAADLRRKVLAMLADPTGREKMRVNNRLRFDRNYSPRSGLTSLESIYGQFCPPIRVAGATSAPPPSHSSN